MELTRMSLIYILLLISYFHNLTGKCGDEHWQRPQVIRADDYVNKGHMVVGLFSITSYRNTDSFDMRVFAIERMIYQLVVGYFNDVFISFDACNSSKIMHEALIKVTLNNSFSETIFIVSYMSFDFTMEAISLLSGTNITLVTWYERDYVPIYVYDLSNIIPTNADNVENIIHNYIDEGITNFLYIDACEIETQCERISNTFIMNHGILS